MIEVTGEKLMALILRYATLQQLGAAFRDRFKASAGSECWRLSRWLLLRIDDGTFTENQVRNFFELTVPQWDTLKAKLEDRRAKWEEMQVAGGE